MRGRTKALLLVGLFIIATLVPVFLPHEPSYAGRTLSEWVWDLRSAISLARGLITTQPGKEDQEDPPVSNAHAALREIGTNAEPHLLRWVAYEQSAWKTNLLRRANRAWEWFGVTNKFSDNQYLRAERAVIAFQELPVLSDQTLARLMVLETDAAKDVSFRAAKILRRFGGASTKALVSLMAHDSARIRELAVIGVGSKPDIELARHELIKRVHDPVPAVAMWATIRLGEIQTAQELLFPTLASSLRHSSADVRSAAACALGNFGTKASPMLPALIAAQDDPEPLVRTNVLRAIAEIQRACDKTTTSLPP